MADYTLAQAQNDIASLRGQLAHQAANAEFLNLTIDTRLLIGSGATLVATDPVSGGPETWHSLGTLAGFTVTLGRYRLTPHNEVEIDLELAGNGTGAITTTFANSLPSAYRPTVDRRQPLGKTATQITTESWPRIFVASANGNVQVIVDHVNTFSNFGVTALIPLD
jgi:hypothetical protein